MIKTLNTIIILSVACWACFSPNLATAGDAVMTDVRIIYASQGPGFIDSGLEDLAEELGSVFRYTSYRLIKEKSMSLRNNQKGVVSLPGKRSLIVTPIRTSEEKIKYQIGIFKSGDKVFGTQILLKDRRSITIGGPKFKNGVLLFNISGKIL